VPWEDPVDLDVDRKAENGSHDYDQSEHADALERRFHRDSADEIGCDENLEADQNPSSEYLAAAPVGEAGVAVAGEDADDGDYGEQEGGDQHRDRDPLERA